ncbi:hypothetical protein F511_42842 [Dorcoceras hygrometricum]|uniref:Uncharacterized protein n=1 Tax=Dorcoceras hygrometricum TaxID=472368 RepID=A0A2Z6ZZ75_9LAMI|nr:hypothetical protein F511_42842 [Dorcoceras hygrometricum]
MKSLLIYREQVNDQLVKDKPARQVVQELIKEEGTPSRKVIRWGRNLLDRETLSSEDDKDQLKSGCKREEKKRALNGSEKQPARRKTSSEQTKMKKSWKAG